jgi:hypothetical protein
LGHHDWCGVGDPAVAEAESRLSSNLSGKGVQINHPQAIAKGFGVMYLITFITSIPAFFFYAPVLEDPRYILGGGGGDTA